MSLFRRRDRDEKHKGEKSPGTVSTGKEAAFSEASEKSGRTEADLKAEAEALEREYGIAEKQYLAKEYYMMPKERMLKAANNARLRDLYVHKVAEENSWTVSEARSAIKAAAEKYGITYSAYYKQGYFHYYGEDQERFHEERMKKKEQQAEEKVDWAEALAERTGVPKEEAASRLATVKEEYGVLPKLYVNNKYYELPAAEMLGRYAKDRRKEAAKAEMYRLMEELSGKGIKQVREELAQIRSLDPGFRVSLKWYFRKGAYMIDPENDREELERLFDLTRREEQLENSLEESFNKIDSGELTYEDISGTLEEYRKLTGETMAEARRRQIILKTGNFLKDVEGEELDKLLIDIEFTNRVLKYFPSEYVAFRFRDKSIPERREYVSSQLRWQVIKILNSTEGLELLDSKYDAYLRVKPLYKREIVLLKASDGYEKFLEYANTHKVFVKKNNYDSLGRGVEKIDLNKNVPLKTVYEEMTADSKQVILEDLIVPADEIRSLNPDSVNTVRIIVFHNDDGFAVQDTFAKIGRKGSFVDNGGAGGIFVHVNKDTGAFDSDGTDEEGRIYEAHPDHGYIFKEKAFPQWEDALETAIAASRLVPEANYIGWDLTFTEDREWIIVEGNSKTQFFAQQMTLGRGIKDEFLAKTHYMDLVSETEEDDDDAEAY